MEQNELENVNLNNYTVYSSYVPPNWQVKVKVDNFYFATTVLFYIVIDNISLVSLNFAILFFHLSNNIFDISLEIIFIKKIIWEPFVILWIFVHIHQANPV